jgi:penicillin-binding protein 2
MEVVEPGRLNGEERARLRLGILGVVSVSLLLVLLARAWYLPTTAPSDEELSAGPRLREVLVPATRGRILGRLDGQLVVLAGNRPVTVITMRRDQIDDDSDLRAQLFGRLAPILDADPEALEERFDDPEYSYLENLPLAEGVDEPTAMYLNERIDDYPGIDVATETTRVYPYGTVASHVIGYIGAIPSDPDRPAGVPLRQDAVFQSYIAQDYRPNDRVGRAGVEQSFEVELRGKPGKLVYEVNARGDVLSQRDDLSYEPVPGNDVVLTLDLRVQQLAEQALRQVVQDRRLARPAPPKTPDPTFDPNETFSVPGASAVVMDAKTGAVIAMASYPTFMPQEILDFRALSPARKAELRPDPADKVFTQRAPLVNRAVSGRYNPGSTFKLVTSWGAVAHGALDPNTRISDVADKGTYRLPIPECQGPEPSNGCLFSNAGKEFMGEMALAEALGRSSDYYFYKLGFDIGIRDDAVKLAIQNEARYLGMGRKSGVQLPEDKAGFIPDQGELDRVCATTEGLARYVDCNPYSVDDGGNARPVKSSEATLETLRSPKYPIAANVNTSIGQGLVEVTPIQLAVAYTALGTRGNVFAPTIVERVIKPSTSLDASQGELVRTFESRVVDRLAVPENVYGPLSEGLRWAVEREKGTAFQVFESFPLNRLPVAGKTGTAQDGTEKAVRDSSLFVAYAPMDDPQFTISVVVEKAGFGRQAAAPVTRLLFEGLNPDLGLCQPGPVEPVSPVPGVASPEPGPLPVGCVLTYGTEREGSTD